jgi:tetratricopeptide (TPR) repeat protein
MWNEVSQWNESAFNAGVALWQPGDTVGDLNHSSDWGQYGDLQRGDLERSNLWITRAKEVLKNNPGDGRSEGTVRNMQARHIIESQQWQTQEYSDDLNANELLALGLSAANLGELGLANRVASRLIAMSNDRPDDGFLKIASMEVTALTRLKEASSGPMVDVAKRQQAIALLTEAVELAKTQRPPNGAANPLKPVHELAGEQMLELGDYAAAAELFEQSLLRMPNRPLSLLGAARSYNQLDRDSEADSMYTSLLAVWNDDSHAAVQEAKRHLGY